VPNFNDCILGIVLFTQAVQVWVYFLWSFTPLTFACLMEALGFVFRALSSRKDPYLIIYFVLPYFFIATAPVFISASIYVCLTEIIAWAEAQGTGFNI
jgi:hypothetical protein